MIGLLFFKEFTENNKLKKHMKARHVEEKFHE